jgi:hypothetical protein
MLPHFRRGLLLMLLMLSCQLHAQQNQPSSLGGKFIQDVSHVLGGTGYVLASPLRWHGRDWAIFGSVMAGTLAVFCG